MTLSIGLLGEAHRQVDPTQLASALGSGALDVFATPAMVALMEQAACAAVEGHLESGQTTVGVRLEIAHLAATPPGVEVRARAELVELDGRRLVFHVEAFDPQDRIGEGRHERALVDPQRLLARANAKRPNNR